MAGRQLKHPPYVVHHHMLLLLMPMYHNVCATGMLRTGVPSWT